MRWYQHMTDAHGDTKIKKLVAEFGAEGYAVYFYCLELIAWDLDGDNITFELEDHAGLIGQFLKVDTLRVEKIMLKCIELGLFGVDDEGTINCMKMAKFLSADFTRNPRLKKIIRSAKMGRIRNKLSADIPKTVLGQSETNPAILPYRTLPDQTLPDHTGGNSNVAQIPYEQIISYLNEKVEKGFGHQTPAYRKLIKARWKEGHGIEDFKIVIDNKVRDWKGKINKDFHGDNFLRPSTLFGPKFDEYLQKTAMPKSNQQLAEEAQERDRKGRERSVESEVQP